MRLLKQLFGRDDAPAPTPAAKTSPDVVAETEHVPATVLGRLGADSIRIVLFPGAGQADGGIPIDVARDRIAADARLPNTALDVEIHRKTKEVIAAQRQEPGTTWYDGAFVRRPD